MDKGIEAIREAVRRAPLIKPEGLSPEWQAYFDVVTPVHVAELIAALEQARAQSSIFPGVMRCPKCDFSRTHINATPKGSYAGESIPEHCPNGCGPMWHGTYKREYNDLYDHTEELKQTVARLRGERDELLRDRLNNMESQPLCVKPDDAMREVAPLCVKLPMPYDINVAGERVDWAKGDNFDRDEVIAAIEAAGGSVSGGE